MVTKILYASGELFTHDLRSRYFSDSNDIDDMRQYLKDRLFALPGEEQVEYDSAQSLFRVIRLGKEWWDMTISRHQLYSLDYNNLSALLEGNTCRLQIAGAVLEEE